MNSCLSNCGGTAALSAVGACWYDDARKSYGNCCFDYLDKCSSKYIYIKKLVYAATSPLDNSFTVSEVVSGDVIYLNTGLNSFPEARKQYNVPVELPYSGNNKLTMYESAGDGMVQGFGSAPAGGIGT
jgi:hypothetical protein